MKLSCECGHLIYDQTDDLPYKAYILRDQDWEESMEQVAKKLMELLNGFREKKASIWSTFKKSDLDWANLESEVSFLVYGAMDNTTTMYECEACGCLILYRQSDQGRAVFYHPKSGNYEHILVGMKQAKKQGLKIY